MSAAGVYGVTSYVTSRRTQEIGLRMALGATPGRVHALVFRQGFLAVGAGLFVGVSLTILLMHVLRGLLVELETGKTEYFLFAVGLVLLFTGIACWIPARRAMNIDPMCALRRE
jgi:ABC-type antimicrobial peptide transport system permease subunit